MVKRNRSKLIILFILFLLSIFLLIVVYRLKTDDVAPDESKAIWGGRENELGYPFAGYLIAYQTTNKASICGSVYISPQIALSAAHCINAEAKSIYLGINQYKYTPSSNVLISDVEVKPEWDGLNNKYDLAIMKMKNANPDLNLYSQVGVPEIGCNYEVLGYGNTEEDETLPDSVRLRKSTEVCINRIEASLLYIQGKEGGICFGDSGSPIFIKDTNKVVGIISGIITTSKDASSYCHIENKAVAVRLDTNLEFINSYISKFNNSSNLAVCGESCSINKCAGNLTCDISLKICKSQTNECNAITGEYCSTYENIRCEEGSNCILNVCVVDTVSNNIGKKNIFTNLNIDFSKIISKDNRKILYISAGVIILLITGFALRKRKRVVYSSF